MLLLIVSFVCQLVWRYHFFDERSNSIVPTKIRLGIEIFIHLFGKQFKLKLTGCVMAQKNVCKFFPS